MKKIIEIKKNTSLSDINEWGVVSNEGVIFNLLSKSSFQVLAEGAAIAKLRDMQLKEVTIEVNIAGLLVEEGYESTGFTSIPKLLWSIFGLELLYVSNKVSSNKFNHMSDLRNILGSYIWGKVQKDKGVIKSGRFVYFVSRNGYEIPVALRESASSSTYPSFPFFRKKVSECLSGFRSSKSVSNSENNLFEWLFHAAENVNDHAIVKYIDKIKTNIPIDGYRGILVEKIILANKDDIKRNDFPEVVQNYIGQRIADGEIDDSLIINIMTVMDVGPGIQNTLSSNEKNSDIELINYAFEDGVTSKKLNSREKAGYGLGEVITAAKKLNALFFVVSGNKSAFYDFSDEPDKQIPNQSRVLIEYLNINKDSGTALSILWAHNPKEEDQLGFDV